MKKTIRHRFEGRAINPDTEILIVGTFNPDIPENSADFFYGRGRNHLWRLLPFSFSSLDLKQATKEEKQAFISAHRIDFIDLITAVNVEEGTKINYADDGLDGNIIEPTKVTEVIDSLSNLKKVVLTRKSFNDVPNIKKLVDVIHEHCVRNYIEFECLPTPARYYNQEKQETWTKAFTL